MSVDYPRFCPDNAGGPPPVLPVMCSDCGTDRDLTNQISYPSSGPSRRRRPGLLRLPRCRHFSEHLAWVADLSVIFSRMDPAGDVLVLGGRYMHCGRPMKASSGLQRLSSSVSTDSADEI